MCLKSHGRCTKQISTKLPTRILDLGIEGMNLDIKLFEPSGASAPYACLSHCWGQNRSFCTKKVTLPSYLCKILWDSLPKTFQDTIYFTRKLGLRYLWIDSLCIIQDDLEDWRKESAKMASVYRNSYIMIAATKSADDSTGCFSDESSFGKDNQITMTWPEGENYQFYIREKIYHFGSISSQSISLFPLLTRGWVYQERLLASRVLHFGLKELLWDCNKMSTCECSSFKAINNAKQDYTKQIEHRPVSEAGT